MHKKLKQSYYILFALSILVTNRLRAQNEIWKPIENKTSFESQFQKIASQTNTFYSPFHQLKTLSLLMEDIESEGEFWFKKDRKIRLEYQKPFHHLLIIDGEMVTIEENDKVSKIDGNSNQLFRKIGDLIMSCIEGKVLTSKNFKPTILESNKKYKIILETLNKSWRSSIKVIELEFEKKNYVLFSIKLIEPSGDSTLIQFLNPKLNEAINNATFKK